MQKVKSIQYLRGIAATLVVLFHAGMRYDKNFAAGNLGVDIFFVISGFVMWFTTCNRTLSPASFMGKRLQRIVPAYWIATSVFVLAWVIKPKFFWGIVVKPIWIVKSLLFIPYYNYSGKVLPVLWQGWTLNIEMLFYVVFALFLYSENLRRRIIGISLSILGLVAIGHFLQTQNAIVRIYMNDILAEFVFGVWLAWAYVRFRFTHVPLIAIGFALVLAGIIECAYPTDFDSDWRSVSGGLAAFLIVSSALVLEGKNLLPDFRTLEVLGDASYSIYLWHSLVMIAFYPLLLKLNIANVWANVVIFAGAGMAGGIAAYYVMERPLFIWLQSRKQIRPA